LTALLLFALVPAYAALGALAAKAGTSILQAALRLRAVRATIGPLWHRGDGIRLVALVALFAAAGWILADAALAVRIVAVACALPGVPIAMVALGLFRPLRVLRYFARRHPRQRSQSEGDVVLLAAADVRRYARRWRSEGTRAGSARQRALYALALARCADSIALAPLARRLAASAIRLVAPATLADLVDADDRERVLRTGRRPATP
jgi:hypothetical protein